VAHILLAATAVWLWAGVPSSRIPEHARTVYVYQGVIVERGGVVSVERRGVYPHGEDGREIVPVVRISGHPPAPDVARLLAAAANAWEARGCVVPMVQIDHDVPSRRVGDYAEFIAAVREHLPGRYALSVTGLADWLVASPREDLLRLARAADEIVFQLYQRRQEVPQIARYDAALAAFGAPFKVGLVPGMDVPARASQSPHWRGVVVFLFREERASHAP
jgi:hypothetical protein